MESATMSDRVCPPVSTTVTSSGFKPFTLWETRWMMAFTWLGPREAPGLSRRSTEAVVGCCSRR